MPRYRHIQNNFLAGELSPKSHGRTDIRAYAEGCETLQNCIAYPQGGASRRTGFQHLFSSLGIVGTGNVALAGDYRLIPFSFSRTEAYVIVLGTKTGEEVRVVNTSSLVQATVTSESLTDYKDFSNYASSQELDEVQFAQSGDFVFLTHPNRPPIYVRRTGENAFIYGPIWAIPESTESGQIITSVEDWESFAYFGENTSTAHTLQASALTGTITVTSNISFFDPGHIGVPFKITSGGSTGIFVPTGFTSDTVVAAEVKSTLPSTSAVVTWTEPAWSDRRGWPRTLTFYEQRLVFGGSAAQPDTLWGSQTGDIFELMETRFAQDAAFGTVTNDRPFNFTISSTEPSEIQWMNSGKTLFIGTRGREYIAQGDATQALGPLAVNFSPETAHGSDFVQAIRVSNTVMFTQKSGQKMREMYFNRDENSFRAKDISLLGEHMVRKSLDNFTSPSSPKIKLMVNQEADNGIVWCLDNNGGLFGCTRDREEDIIAWHYHIPGGVHGISVPKVISIAVLPSPDGTHDDLWAVIKRTINGSEVSYIERMGKEFILEDVSNSSDSILDKPIYSDSSLFLQATDGFSFHADYATVIDGTEGDGSLTGVGVNSPTISSGRLDLTGGAVTGVTYSAVDNGDSQQVGCVRMNLIFDFSAATTGDIGLFSVRDTAVSTNNEITLFIQDKGTGIGKTLTLVSRDSGGTLIHTSGLDEFGEFIPVEGVEYEFELNWNYTTGATRLFINGKQYGDTLTDTGTRDSNINHFEVGSDTNTGKNTDHYVNNIVLFSTVQHTEDYTPSVFFKTGVTIPGLDHLEGQSVQVIQDGFFEGSKTVSSGTITLDGSATEVTLGLEYSSVIKTLPIDAGSAVGSSQGAISRIDKLIIRFFRTFGAMFGSDINDLDEIAFRQVSDIMGDPVPLFTGDKTLMFPADPSRKAQAIVTQTAPFPMSTTAIIMRGVEND